MLIAAKHKKAAHNAVTTCRLQTDSDVHVPDFVIYQHKLADQCTCTRLRNLSAQACWPNARDLETIYTLARHQDSSGTRCLPPPSSLLPWPGSGSVLQNTDTYHQTTERHIQLNIHWSNNLKCDSVTETCFGIPTASPDLSPDRICKILEVHS